MRMYVKWDLKIVSIFRLVLIIPRVLTICQTNAMTASQYQKRETGSSNKMIDNILCASSYWANYKSWV